MPGYIIKCVLALCFTGSVVTVVLADSESPASVDPAIVAASLKPLPEFKSKSRDPEETKNNALLDDLCLEEKEGEPDRFQDPLIFWEDEQQGYISSV